MPFMAMVGNTETSTGKKFGAGLTSNAASFAPMLEDRYSYDEIIGTKISTHTIKFHFLV